MVTHGGYPHTVYEEKTYCIDPDDITIRGDTTLCDEQRVHLSLQFSEHLSIPPAIAEQLYSITRFGPDGESIDTGGFLHYVPESNGTYRMEAVSFCDALATFEKEFTIQRSE